MAFLALTRNGIDAFVLEGKGGEALWVAGGILNENEMRQMRTSGTNLTVFSHSIRTKVQIEDALQTMQQHHPDEGLRVEDVQLDD
jgi:hypothetical protein